MRQNLKKKGRKRELLMEEDKENGAKAVKEDKIGKEGNENYSLVGKGM